MEKELRLVGFCVYCRRAAFGEIWNGKFTCHQCMFRPTVGDSSLPPHSYYFTFTTSNSSGTSNGTGADPQQ